MVRKSLEGFIDAVDTSSNFGEFYNNVNSSNWTDHLSSILTSSLYVAEKVASGSPLILHCSDGWDRTSQVGALSQLLMDPFYRTIEGFCVLVSKDWCKFGHQFQHRIGHTNPIQYNPSHGAQNLEQEVSPIFAQWLECVYQLMRVAPEDFEFNERMLVEFYFYSTACQFGNFLTNCDKDREQLLGRTYCFWEYVLENRSNYQSSTKMKNDDQFLERIKRINATEPWSMWSFWTNMYRQKLSPQPQQAIRKPSIKSESDQLANDLGYCTVSTPATDMNKNNLDPLGVL